jgi:hypothetical protein
MRIEITKEIDDLNKVRWEFWLRDGEYLYLDAMYVMSRDSKRHKFMIDETRSYHRLEQRRFSIVKEEPEVPFEIQLEALSITRRNIKFKKWEKL